MQGILLEGVSAGCFRPEIARDAEKIAIDLLAYLDGIFLHAMLSDPQFLDLKAQLAFHMKTFIDYLMASGERAVS